jgi:hypothetical protein
MALQQQMLSIAKQQLLIQSAFARETMQKLAALSELSRALTIAEREKIGFLFVDPSEAADSDKRDKEEQKQQGEEEGDDSN